MKFLRLLKSRDTFAIAFLAAWPFACYWPVAAGQKIFSEGDLLWLFLPVRTELARALAEGRLPLWTPGIQSGFPLFAEGEVAALYPLNLLFHRLLPAYTALSYTILFNLAWASVGMYLLVRACGLRVASALLAGLVFGAGGFVTAQVSHSPHLAVASWLPWLVFLQRKYWQARLAGAKTVRWFLLTCLSIALQFLGGFPQIALLNVATFALFGVFAPLIWGDRTGAPTGNWITTLVRWLPKAVLMSVLSVTLGIGLAAIQLLPTAELVGFSIRGQEVGGGFFTSYSLEPSALTQFISPFGYLGEPAAGNMEFWGYLGVLPFFLAVLALFLRRDARTWFFFLFALLSLSLALGESNPWYGWLYYIPVFNRFRVPARFLLLFTFAAAFLAATGFEELRARLRPSPEIDWIPRTLAVAFGALTLSVIALGQIQPPRFWLDVWSLLPGFLVLLGVGAIIAARLRLTSQIVFGVIVLGLTAFDLTTFSMPFLKSLAQMTAPSELVGAPRTIQAMDASQTMYRVFSYNFPEVTRAAARNALMRNLALLYGKQAATAYMPSLGLRRNEEYLKAMSAAMRNLANIRYHLFPLEFQSWATPPSGKSQPDGGLTLDVLSQPPSIPPTRVARVEVVSYTDQTQDLGNGFLAGELVLSFESGASTTQPIRLGSETADWAYDGIARLGQVNHSRPADALAFPAFLSSVGREFEGHKYIARYDVDASSRDSQESNSDEHSPRDDASVASDAVPLVVTAVGVRSFLPGARLTVERIALIDETGHSVSLASLIHRNDLTLAFRSHTAAIWENQDALPRAFVVHRAEIVRDEQMLTRLRSSDFRPDRVVLLSDGQPLGQQEETGQEQTKDQVTITEYKPERVAVTVKTDRAGYLVLADSWYPGWEVRVDGQVTSLYRADYIFRAVPILPGQHRVVFEYRPDSFAIGTVISGLSVIICAIVAVVGYFRLVGPFKMRGLAL